jgi:hypothetical protein
VRVESSMWCGKSYSSASQRQRNLRVPSDASVWLDATDGDEHIDEGGTLLLTSGA